MRDGATLLLVGARDHAWWRNLRGGVPVAVRIQGRDFVGSATALAGEAAVADGGLLTLLRRVPQYRAYWGAALDPAGNPVGLVLGPVLGCAQWLVLRRQLAGAGLWMPANALAWAFGVVIVFAGVSAVFDRGVSPGSIMIGALSLAATGAVVGDIDGLALAWLVGQCRRAKV